MFWKFLIALFIVFAISLGFYALKGNSNENREHKEVVVISDASDKAPKKQIKQHVPKFMLDLYHQNVNESFFGGPDIVRSVIPKTAGSTSSINEKYYEDKHLLLFNIPRANKDEEFLNAELKILMLVEDEEFSNIEKLVKISIFDEADDKLLFLDKFHFHYANATWLSFNLTPPVDFLLQKKDSETLNLRVLICLKSYVPNGVKLFLMPKMENYEHDYPILLLSYNLKENRTAKSKDDKRGKRSYFEEDYEEETNNVWDDDVLKIPKKLRRARNMCRKRPLYIDFAEIDYDTWIVQPSGYEAFQCQGKCFYPVAEHLSPTKHAIVQALIHSVAPSKASRSCCVPTKLDPISVLYVDNRGVLTYRYAYGDMVVTECGCR